MNFKKNIYALLAYRIAIIIVIYTIFRLLFFWLNQDVFSYIQTKDLFTLLAAGITFDISAIFYINSVYILGQTIPFNFRYKASYQKGMKILYCVSNSLFFFFNCADLAYFKFLYRRTTLSVFREFSNDVQNTNMVLQLILDYWWVFAIWIAFTILIIFIYGTTKLDFVKGKTKSVYVKQTLAMFAIVGVLIIGMRGNLVSQPPIDMNHAALKVKKPIENNIVLNTSFTLIRAFKQKSIQRINYYTDTDALEQAYSPNHYPKKNDEEFKNKNVFIIILEGISKSFIGHYNHKVDSSYRSFTPFLDTLLTKSLSFDHSYANSYTSMNAVPAILASLPTLLNNDNFLTSIYSNNNLVALSDLLSDKGYNCSFFHGANNGSMRFTEFTKRIGFHNYYGRTEYNNEADYDGAWGIFDEPFLQYAANTVNEKKQPFLATLFTLTTHVPWPMPKKYENKFPKGGIDNVYETIGYLDYSLNKFFETASTMPWFNNTLFVIVSDHTFTTDYLKYNTSIGKVSIPIIFYDPSGEIKPFRDEEKIIQQIDIMPSILDYLNYDKPYFAFGSSVFDSTTNRFSVGVVNGTHQLIYKDYLIHVNNGVLVGYYKFREDKFLENNLIDTGNVPQDVYDFYKAFIQQYNNRLIENRTVLDK